MIVAGQYITASPEGSNTEDIMYQLAIAATAAIRQYKNNPILAERINAPANNPELAGIKICRFIQSNVKYKADGYTEQQIKLPAQLIKTGIGDCKSFALFFLAAAYSAGYEAGLRFASYSKNKKFTHVYNYIKYQNKIYTFDACVKDLKESNKYTNIKDMKVTYLAGTPSMISESNQFINAPYDDAIGKRSKAEKKAKREERKQKREERKQKRKEGGGLIKRAVKAGKKVALAAPRGSFLLLVDINFRGIARKLAAAREKSPSQYKELWLKLGGDPDKLDKAVSIGLKKKPFLGTKKGLSGPYTEPEYIGVVAAATVTGAVTSAAALLAAFQKLFKTLGIKSKKEEGTDDEMEDLLKDEEGNTPVVAEEGNFNAADPDGEEARDYTEQGKFNPRVPKLNATSAFNPLVIVVVTVGSLLLLKAFKGKK